MFRSLSNYLGTPNTICVYRLQVTEGCLWRLNKFFERNVTHKYMLVWKSKIDKHMCPLEKLEIFKYNVQLRYCVKVWTQKMNFSMEVNYKSTVFSEFTF